MITHEEVVSIMKTPIVQEIPEQQNAAQGAVIGGSADHTETYDVSLIRRALAMERAAAESTEPPAPAA